MKQANSHALITRQPQRPLSRDVAALFLASLAIFVGTYANVHAQTNYVIKTATPDLEAEYQQELDKWMLRAYEGDRDAQFKVGVLFTNEQFKQADYEQAVYWYKQAARQGHVLAQYNLGHQYLVGIGVQRDETTAMSWWLKAADQDHALAQFNVGRAYYLGIGLAKDYAQSRLWFERAARNNEPKSIDILIELGWASPNDYKQHQQTDSTDKSPPTITATTALTATAQAQHGNTLVDQPVPEPSAQALGPKQPIAIYTNPSVRHVLIAFVNYRNELSVVSRSEEWTSVVVESGFPVWVHEDFIAIAADNIGTIVGDRVNARSVPKVTKGSIVGKLDNKEKLTVLDQRDNWVRAVSPKRFKAWVKTAEYERGNPQNDPSTISVAQSPEIARASVKAEQGDNGAINTGISSNTSINNQNIGDDNEWLFNQPSEHYTLQLASFDDSQTVEQFISRKEFKNNPQLRRFTSNRNDIQWTYFLYGSYKAKSQAESSREQIGQKRAWVRSFGNLQENRCVAWKKQIPTPKTLNQYCIQ